MKKLARILMITTTLFIGVVIGTIALYANNDGFKGLLDGMVNKYAEKEHPSEYVLTGSPSSDRTYGELENNEDSNIQVTDLPEDYWQQVYADTYGAQPGEESYENYIYDETSDIAAAYEATSEPELPDMQIQEDTSTIGKVGTQQPSEEPVKSTTNIWDLIPRDVIDNIVSNLANTSDDGELTEHGYEQYIIAQNAPWQEAGFSSLEEAWWTFLYTQPAISHIHGAEDFIRWCEDIINGVGSPYDFYGEEEGKEAGGFLMIDGEVIKSW